MKRYNPKDIEPKWQKTWADQELYKAIDFDERPKFTMLTEFPYPSGDGLHLGHIREYTYGDILARHQRMQGKNVLFPMAYDAFGLPTQNYAIKNHVTPQEATDTNIANFQRQFESLGYSFDWSRTFRTSDPSYYRWTQALFLKFFEKGLAYQAETSINWCPHCKTGLSNEEVINGRHERCDTLVEKKVLKQWLLKITDYAERLIDGLKDVDYPSRIADQQINWIGKSKGAEIEFPLESNDNFVLLHGFTGSPQNDFFPYAKTTLEAKNFKVDVPQLPNTDKPDAKEQAAYVLESSEINENTVLLGHSYGSVTALRILEQVSAPIKKLVIVSGFAQPGFSDRERVFEPTTDWDFDFEKIKKNAHEIVILRPENDSAVPAKRAAFLQSKLGGQIIDFIAEGDHTTGAEEPVVVQNLLPTLRVFTTRQDTIYGATFLVLAPEHPMAEALTKPEHKDKVFSYIKSVQARTDVERQDTKREKTGVFTGAYAINPMTNQSIPIWIADYVLVNYGSGAIMAVPAHDERDWQFAKKHDLEIKRVISNSDPDDNWTSKPGKLINSGEFDGMDITTAKNAVLEYAEKHGFGEAKVQYKLRDWIFSRQHYWGEPIPIIHCPDHGAVAVPDKDLPVVLPEVTNYEALPNGDSPLSAEEAWVNVACPVCGGPAKRETDTMPNWAGSSWYYMRYYDPHNDKVFAERDKLDYWREVDLYLGGMEHTTLHLLYSRFWHQFFYDQGMVPTKEPYAARRGQGIILAADGTKMSKSKGNVVNPSEVIDSGYGADALRLAIAFLAPYDQTTPWNPEGVAGTYRFLQRVWQLVQTYVESDKPDVESPDDSVKRVVNKTLKRVSDDLDRLNFNTAIAAQMELMNSLSKLLLGDVSYSKADWQFAVETVLLMVAPFSPHISEELWSELGKVKSIHISPWPNYEQKYLNEDEVTIVVQVNGKLRSQFKTPIDSDEQTIVEQAKADPKVASYLENQEVKKTIYIKGKLVNFVT